MRLMPICLLRTCPPICVYCRSVNSRRVHINESTADLSTADLSTYMRLLQICLQPTCPPKCVYCRSIFCRTVHLNVSTADLSTAHRSFNRCIPSPRPTYVQVLSSLPSIFRTCMRSIILYRVNLRLLYV